MNEELEKEVKRFFEIKYMNYIGPGFTIYDECFLLYETDKGKFCIGFFCDCITLSLVKEMPDGKFSFACADRVARIDYDGINTVLRKNIFSEDTSKTFYKGKAFDFDKEIVALKLEGYDLN